MRPNLKFCLLVVGMGCLLIKAAVANGLFMAAGLLPPGYFVLTSDDGPAATTFSGQNNTLMIARNLHDSGIGAAFFMVTCHFGQGNMQGATVSPACPAMENQP